MRAAATVVLLFMTACSHGDHVAVDAAIDASCEPRTTGEIDVLFVVSGASYASGAQAAAAGLVRPLLRSLSSGDVDGDGLPDQTPASSIHVGVVSANLGVGETPQPQYVCDQSRNEDARLRGEQPIVVLKDAAAVGSASSAIGRMLAVGDDDCIYVQALEAGLKALSPAAATDWTRAGYVAPTFFRGAGHGDGRNEGLVRSSSVLVVIWVSTFEDMSAEDTRIYDIEIADYGAGTYGRGVRHPEALWPIERYVDGLLALRKDPRRLVVGGIVGIPSEVVSDPANVDYEAALAHPSMQARFVGEAVHPAAVCQGPGVGHAYAGRRFVGVAQALENRGAQTFMASVCDWTSPPPEPIARTIGLAMGSSCAPE